MEQEAMTAETQETQAQATEPVVEAPKNPRLAILERKLELEGKQLFTRDEFLELKTLKKKVKRMMLEEKKFKQQYVAKYIESQKRMKKVVDNMIKTLRQNISKADYKMLVEFFTIVTPEEKNEAGEVVVPESRRVNYEGLAIEGLNIIASKRQERIRGKIRKTTTGSHSNRKNHKSKMAFIEKRNAEEKAKEEGKK